MDDVEIKFRIFRLLWNRPPMGDEYRTLRGLMDIGDLVFKWVKGGNAEEILRRPQSPTP